jgi:hypothetical protein
MRCDAAVMKKKAHTSDWQTGEGGRIQIDNALAFFGFSFLTLLFVLGTR